MNSAGGSSVPRRAVELPDAGGGATSCPTLVETVRAFGVVYGPAVLGYALVGASLLATARAAGQRPPRCRTGRLWRAVAALGTAALPAYLVAVRPWLLRWGATDAEAGEPLPGDSLVPRPGIQSTRAVTIQAPVEAVWPWLAQIGQDRGGFYSYEWLENLAGCQMRNADRVHPEWQQRTVGELVRLHPRAGLRVSLFEPNRVLGLEGWGVFVLQPLDARRTRLIARSRGARTPGALLLGALGEIPHFVMERRMLLGIKERAERAWAAGAKTGAPVAA